MAPSSARKPLVTAALPPFRQAIDSVEAAARRMKTPRRTRWNLAALPRIRSRCDPVQRPGVFLAARRGRKLARLDRRPALRGRAGTAAGSSVHGGDLSESGVARYFGLDVSMDKIFASFPADDPWLARARLFAPGLRILRQEPWGNALQFHLLVAEARLSRSRRSTTTCASPLGRSCGAGEHVFPSAAQLARVSEAGLRACRLGVRARHLFVAARRRSRRGENFARPRRHPADGGGAEGADACARRGREGGQLRPAFRLRPARGVPDRRLGRARFTAALFSQPAKDQARRDAAFFRTPISARTAATRSSFFFHWIRNDPTALEDAG